MKKIDYKKDYKKLYLPNTKPEIIQVPLMNFAMISGKGDPNGEEFAEATAALYSFSYAVKMSYKCNDVPAGYYEYTVFPLEGVWDLFDKSISVSDKSNYAYEIMIRQPEFLNETLYNRFLTEIQKKKPNPFNQMIQFISMTDGLCCQMMHVGSYDAEPASFEMMENFCKENGYIRSCKKHREIYLSDPRKTEPSKLKTVLRFHVEKC